MNWIDAIGLKLRESRTNNQISAESLRDKMRYDPITGEFFWKIGRRKMNVGSLYQNGYIVIMVDGVRYYAHRLAWLYITGNWPAYDIDHINQNRADNRFINLREATRPQNNVNSNLRSDNKTGYKGVFKLENGKYLAHITINRKRKYLGSFISIDEAVCVRRKAAREAFGEFYNE